MLRKNLKNPRWWAALVPGLLFTVVAIPAELIAKVANWVLDQLCDWVYDWGA